MTEVPLLFGPAKNLVGTLAQPPGQDGSDLAFLMFNAGVLSRIGPHRLNVKIARALAVAGQTSLRFDLSGRGDSRDRGAASDVKAQAASDLRLAMDYLESIHGVRRFALIGICSGAVEAFRVALLDSRVVGVMMFDGHWYRTRWTKPVRHWKRLRAKSLPELLATLRRLARPAAAPDPGTARVAESEPANPPRVEFVSAVQSLIDRRVATCFVYSGSVIEYYSYANQFRDAFRREAFFDKVRCEFRPDIDHTFISLDAQRSMIDLVLDWIGEVRGAGAVRT